VRHGPLRVQGANDIPNLRQYPIHILRPTLSRSRAPGHKGGRRRDELVQAPSLGLGILRADNGADDGRAVGGPPRGAVRGRDGRLVDCALDVVVLEAADADYLDVVRGGGLREGGEDAAEAGGAEDVFGVFPARGGGFG
jgi:hypothetical protein